MHSRCDLTRLKPNAVRRLEVSRIALSNRTVPSMTEPARKPDFLLIGAQKSGTSWLWDQLEQHPETDLPATKEIHFFGGSENYQKGRDWYYEHFRQCAPGKITGEASTSYLYSHVPFWFNPGRELQLDASLPCLPELVAGELPDVKLIVVLRDPVARALSAYRHWMKKGELPPLAGLKNTALQHPKLRIIEYGNYAEHLQAWLNVFPRERFLLMTFEDDIVGEHAQGLRQTYEFLGMNPDFIPPERERGLHRSWSWTRSAVSYYAGPFRRRINHGRLGTYLDRHDFLKSIALRPSDIEFLRSIYLPQRGALQDLLQRSLDSWTYGENLQKSPA